MLLVFAGFFRLWRINDLTEFLGDQGRTGMIIYEAWKVRQLPLVGPPVLTGQFLGPAFYYIIGLPFVFGGFHPIIPSIFMAMLGILAVLLLYRFASILYGSWIGIAVAGLYAVSPSIVRADRTLWEPTIVPLFVIFFLYLAYRAYEKQFPFSLLPLGIVVGILVQLHYPNVIFVGLSLILILAMALNKRCRIWPLALGAVGGVIGFFGVLTPFFVYEMSHAWADVREIAFTMLTSGGNGAATVAPMWEQMIDYSSRLFGTMIPGVSRNMLIAIQLFAVVALFWKRSFWSFFWGVWYVGGIAAISLYKGTVFDHYLHFMLPLPFVFMGGVLQALESAIPKKGLIIISIVLFVWSIHQTDVFTAGPRDISRIGHVVDVIRDESGATPYSFALFASRSFSDLHYRYFFLWRHNEPVIMSDPNYRRLFLVCESEICPGESDMKEKTRLDIVCFKRFCGGEHPVLDLTGWQLDKTSDVENARIYVYNR